MLKIRLAKTGKRNAPSFRMVVIEADSPRDGRNIEVIGHYNPSHNPEKFEYNKDRYNYWKSVGAKPSDTVEKLISKKYKFIKYNPAEKKEETTEEAKNEAVKEEVKDEVQNSEEK